MLRDLSLISQRRINEPILNLSIFSNRNVSAANGVNLLVGFCIMVALVSVPIFINVAGSRRHARAALVTGYLLCAFTVPMALAAIPGGWLSSATRLSLVRHRRPGVAIVGFLMMSFWRVEMASTGRRASSSTSAAAQCGRRARHRIHGGRAALAGIGIGLTIAPIGTAVINGVRDQERGMASSLVIILRLIGMSVSMSSMTAYGLRRTTVLGRKCCGRRMR